MSVPTEIVDWFRSVFAECNRRIARKIFLVTRTDEVSLDMAMIEFLSEYSSPRLLPSGYIVQIDTHFLGGLRHWMNHWEIADIGLLVHYQSHGKRLLSKAAVLQSKRLYPKDAMVPEENRLDYQVGFARLANQQMHIQPYLPATVCFDSTYKYEALRAGDEQMEAIRAYTQNSQIPVFYQFYNPPSLPLVITTPRPLDIPEPSDYSFATRVLTAEEVIRILDTKRKQVSPAVSDFAGGMNHEFGWRLENFVADQLIACNVGYRFNAAENDDNIYGLFNRRGGAISAAVAFTIDVGDAEVQTWIKQ